SSYATPRLDGCSTRLNALGLRAPSFASDMLIVSASPPNQPRLPAEGSAGAGKDYGKPQVNKKKFGRRKRTRQ
ncbi:hypothetical protein, partial [Rhizobium ruizarguesonis]|uniref:hypothetical protein n=1 Tax=Rhizobium ruizarguesonis TaxID=2081791 RepID=UPI0019542E4B